MPPKAPDTTEPMILIKPPPEIDATPPAFANQVRVLGGTDAMIVHLYFVSPTRLLGVEEGHPQPGVRKEKGNIVIETEPVARVSIPLTTAAELATLIIKTAVESAPSLGAHLVDIGTRITEIMSTAQDLAQQAAAAGAVKEE